MNIKVLGPLSFRHGAVEMAPAAPKPRKLLALLLLNHQRVISVPTLIDELWQAGAPNTARTALQVYVFNLRKKVAQVTGLSPSEVAETVLQKAPNGYRFAVDPGQFDLRTFRWLERAGGTALAAGDLRSAAQHFHRALDLWRGPAVADVEAGIGIRAEIAALEHARMTMLDYRIELDLRLGLHRELLSELAVLTSRYPCHEVLHAQYMIALYRSGHRIRALEVFQDLRNRLIGEHGLEPSATLRRCHQAVLALDPALDEAEVVPLPLAPAADLPAQASSF